MNIPISGFCIRTIIGCLVISFLMTFTGCEKLELLDNSDAISPSSTSQIDEISAEMISDAIIEEINANELVGVQVSIVDSLGETWTHSSGSADIERMESLHDEHIFRIGSVSKIYTSTIVVKLSEDGILDLDQKISEYFPDFPNAHKISIRNLLNHSSGIRDVFSLPDLFLESSFLPDKIWNHQEVAETCLGSELLFNPGEETHYSSANFILAAIIAEKATGKEILDLYHEIICSPLGLSHTFFLPYESHPPLLINGFVHRFAFSLSKWYIHTTDQTSWSTAAHASGALAANSKDLSWFIHHLFFGSIVNHVSLAEMTTFFENKGFGLFKFNVNGRAHWGHEGEIMGFEAITAYNPQTKITYAICCNTTPYDIYHLLDIIEHITYQAAYK
jgi:D-alanyl-D-alanine carboxypeptidase